MKPESRTNEKGAVQVTRASGSGSAPLISEFEQDGFRLAFRVCGRGDNDVVFVHGLYSSATAGLPLADVLADRHRVWAPDLPGHGASGPFPGEASVEEAARAVSLFIRHQCNPPVAAVIGHSMGCVVALHLANAQIELLRSLVLIAGPAIARRTPWWARGLACSGAAGVATGAAMAVAIRSGELLRRLLFRRSALLKVLLQGALSANTGSTVGMVRSASKLDPVQVTSTLGDLPCLILSGTHDRIVRPFHALEMHRLMPQARMHWLSGADHLAPYTDPERVARYVNSFLKRL